MDGIHPLLISACLVILSLVALQLLLMGIMRLNSITYKPGELHLMKHYFSRGQFFNPEGTPRFTRPDNMVTLLKRLIFGKEERRPKKTLPVVKASRALFDHKQDLRVTWLGHATTLIEIEGTRLLTDPVFGTRCSPVSFAGPKRFSDLPLELEELPALDAVLISHNHYDHLERSSVTKLGARGVLFVVPAGVAAYLRRWGIASSQIRELRWWETTEVKGIAITAAPAHHFSQRALELSNRTLWASYAIRGTQRSIYFGGDTGWFDGLSAVGERLGPFDVTMLEVGAYDRSWATIHLGPEKALRAHQALRGALFLPIHWGTFTLALHDWFEPAELTMKLAQEAEIPFHIPRQGDPFHPLTPPPTDPWWRAHTDRLPENE